MRNGDRVRWSEAHCRLEALKARAGQSEAVYAELRKQIGRAYDPRRIGGVQVVDVMWDAPSPHWVNGPHILPAELLEVAS